MRVWSCATAILIVKNTRLHRATILIVKIQLKMSVLMAYRSGPCVFAIMMKMVLNTLFSYHSSGRYEHHSDTFNRHSGNTLGKPLTLMNDSSYSIHPLSPVPEVFLELPSR